jgi:transcriptional regulator with XRE-family HTH domain
MKSHIRIRRLDGLPADLVQRLVEARHAHGWSQRELARRVGLPQVHISAIETGKVSPRFNTLLDLVRVLDHDLILVPRALVPAVQALIRDDNAEDGERSLYADDSGHEHES